MSARSWASTLRLPKSSFPPRPERALRHKYIQRCADDLYRWQAASRSADRTFVIHDGPPYANGELHVGHALNKTLKDMMLRVKLQQGHRVQYRPSWDCHGLPIELKALGSVQAATPLAPAKVRELARNLATTTVESQMKSFREFGVMADWDRRWLTMQPSYVADQLRLFQRMVGRGLIYRRHKPVYWSPSSGTALAEAELEYNEAHVSTSAYVKLPLVADADGPPANLPGVNGNVKLVIWTTTPWTLPANQAVAVHEDLDYLVLKIGSEALVIGASALERITAIVSPQVPEVLLTLKGKDLVGLQYRNRLQGRNAQLQPIIHADFVSAESGSGLVHLAPGHGFDDYLVCNPLGLPAVSAVDGAGMFAKDICPDLEGLPREGAGADVLKGGSKVIIKLLGDDVLYTHKHKHKYPYDWRTKQPIVVRATAQWFAGVSSIKDAALDALNGVKFVPEAGRTRLESFIKGRTEWCISRQRAWGVPIPALYDGNGNAFMTEDTIEHIIKTIEQRGVDAWWSDDAGEPAWIPDCLRGRDLRRGTDTMDVWFDSGSSWTQTNGRADIYLEGSDQHRGWFQSSLLTRVAAQPDTRIPAEAPFRTLVTHGFTLDGKGKKMSKSLGNTILPAQVMDGSLLPPLKRDKNKKKDGEAPNQDGPKYDALGPDALRLWAAGSDYTKDVVISEQALMGVHTTLRKFRTILKMLLGSLQERPSGIAQPFDAIDQIAMMQLGDAMAVVGRHYDAHEFYKAVAVLNHWVAQHLSAEYLEALKDKLYCGGGAGVVALVPVFDGMCRMLAPIAPLLVEEAWDHAPEWLKLTLVHPHQRLYTDPLLLDPSVLTIDEASLRAAIPTLEATRAAINMAAEQGRLAKKIGQSLQAAASLHVTDERVLGAMKLLGEEQLAAYFVVSGVEINPTDIERAERADGLDWEFTAEAKVEEGAARGAVVKAVVRHPAECKCPRCWRYVAPSEDELCGRCEDVVKGEDGDAAGDVAEAMSVPP